MITEIVLHVNSQEEYLRGFRSTYAFAPGVNLSSAPGNTNKMLKSLLQV